MLAISSPIRCGASGPNSDDHEGERIKRRERDGGELRECPSVLRRVGIGRASRDNSVRRLRQS